MNQTNWFDVNFICMNKRYLMENLRNERWISFIKNDDVVEEVCEPMMSTPLHSVA